MDKVAPKAIAPQAERELTSPLSPKRLRTDCTMTDNHSGKRRFDIPKLLTFQKTFGSPSLENTPQKNVVLTCTAGSGDIRNEKPHQQTQDAKLIVTTISKMSASHSSHTGLSKVCVTTAESHLLHRGKDEQTPLTETDKLSSYPPDDAGRALAESHTSRDASADTSSHPDCKRLGKSLEDEAHGRSRLPSGNEEDGRQVQNNVREIPALNLSSSDEQVRCQSDCTHAEALCEASFCNTWSQSAKVKVSNQERDKLGFRENILFSKGAEEANSHISPSDYADSKSFHPNPGEDPSGNLAGGVKNEEKISELQICESEEAAACDGETKGHVNENGTSKQSIPSQVSTVSYDVVLARNTAAENVSVEVDDFCGANGERTAGKMTAKARSEKADHTTETPMPARISQEPAKGDNNPGPFSVIDPAILSETDWEAEEKRCNSECDAGLKLSPSVEVGETETPPPLCSDVRPTHEVSAQFNHQSATQQCPDERAESRQSYEQPPACSIPVNKMQGTTRVGCHWESSPSSSPHGPANPPPAGDGGQESLTPVRHEQKEQDQSDCFPVSLDHLVSEEDEYSQTEIARTDRTTVIKDKEAMTSFEQQMISNELWNLEKAIEPEDELLQLNEKHKDTCVTYISDWTEGEIGECDSRLSLSEDEETTEERERKEKANAGEDMKTEEDLQQQIKYRTDTTQCVSEWTGGDKLRGGSQHEQGNELGCFPDIVENKDDLSAFTFTARSDAVVPCMHDVNHSQNSYPTAPQCNDRSAPLPSALTFCDRVAGGFDTFEKIQLSPDDDDSEAAGLDGSPLLTSLARQLLKTSERQLSRSKPVSDSQAKTQEAEEEVGRFEGDIENMVDDFLSSNALSDDLASFIAKSDIIALAWTEQKPNCESARERVQEESASPSDVNTHSEFEMKRVFNLVMKELNLFFDISTNDLARDSRKSSPEQRRDPPGALVSDASNCKDHLRDTSSDDADEDTGLDVSGEDPVVSCTTGSCGGEQEVPLGSHACQETAAHTAQAAETHREPRETEQRRKIWSPSFECPLLLDQPSHKQHKRLEPLRTCTRPIRVGLSKRAKTKCLHRPHPYK